MDNPVTEHMDIWTASQRPKANGGKGRGNGSANHTTYGIKKLRELILGLAVCGKLVPQDPNDLPAELLLKKIAQEKERLIKEGKIKKQKPLPEIGEDEKPFELPEGWEWTRLGDVTNYGISDKTEPNSVNDDTWVLELEDVEKETSKLLQKVRFADRQFRSSKSRFCERDVIYGKLRPYLDKVIIADEDGVCTTEMIPLKGYGYITPEYLRLVMKSPYFIWYANESTHGMNLPRLGTPKARLALFPMVSETQQHGIVAKVDELMALCDMLEQQQTDSNATHQTLVETLLTTLTNAAGQDASAEAWQRIADHFDTLFTTEQSIDQIKQTILQLAVMGRLVPQDLTDLPAPQSGKFFVYALECEDKNIYIGQTDDVLARWKEHATGKGANWTKKHPPLRLVHWEEYNSREEAIKREKELKTGFGRKWIKRELAAGRTRQAGEPASVLLEKITKEKTRLTKEGKIKKQKPLPEIADDEKPYELPLGWEWVRFGVTFDVTSSKRIHVRDYVPEGVPFFRSKEIGELKKGKSISTDIFISYEKFEELRHLPGFPNVGDLMLTSVGSIGNTWICDGRGFYYKDGNITKVGSHQYADMRYTQHFIDGPLFNIQVTNTVSGTAYNALTIVKLNNLIYPLPPIAEQHRIVAKVDELMALCDTMKARLNNAQTTQVQLADVIVEQAVV